MFRTALVLLTVVAVLWHALAGCCAHHDHAAATTTEATSCGCHSHACGEKAAERSHASERAKHEDESDALVQLASPHDSSSEACGDRCSFPQPEGNGVSLVKHSLAACDLSLPVALLVESNVAPQARSTAFDAPPPPHVGHALRRHLALGVLLI
jgi:hypothetical protein